MGAGEAAIGIADLCVKAMCSEGMTLNDARNRIWMMDIDGLLIEGRHNLDGHKVYYAKKHVASKNFHQLVKELKPTVLIGASAVKNAFTPAILKCMAENNQRPIIFALSNPTDKAECTAEEAYTHTNVSLLCYFFEKIFSGNSKKMR